MTKYLASIQVRMNSSRLPKKAIEKIGGLNSIEWMVLRLKKSKKIDKIVIATSTSEMDNEIEDLCNKLEVDCFRGSEEDVLNRISTLLQHYNYENHIEFYGDSPFPDAKLVDEFIFHYEKSKVKFLSNTNKTTFPPGFEVIVYRSSELIAIENNRNLININRSHCGVNLLNYLKKNSPNELCFIEATKEHFYPNLHFELDTKEDLDTLRFIIPIIQNEFGNYFSIDDVLRISLKNLHVFAKNTKVERRYEIYRNG